MLLGDAYHYDGLGWWGAPPPAETLGTKTTIRMDPVTITGRIPANDLDLARNTFVWYIDNTGIVNFACESWAKSRASCGHDAKYVQAARIRPGFEYASV